VGGARVAELTLACCCLPGLVAAGLVVALALLFCAACGAVERRDWLEDD
jgi:hypothetical protein